MIPDATVPDAVVLDAVVLAGGRSSRLGGVAKATLRVGDRTLLEHTLDAAAAARSIVVVGDPAVIAAAAPGRVVAVTRESPAFAGPAAAIGAGLELLAREEWSDLARPDLVLVLACDMPGAALAVDALLAAVAGAGTEDGAVAVSADGRVQHLVGAYPTGALRAAVGAAGNLEGLSARALLRGLRPTHVGVPPGATDDVDTWDDASALRAEAGASR